MGTQMRVRSLERAASKGSVAMESIAPMRSAVFAPSALRFQPTMEP